ncbi:MAG: hypothetical protein ABSA33_03255 [Candidatus Micrarchaeaceae archaeon]|jgi:hypothetical protein
MCDTKGPIGATGPTGPEKEEPWRSNEHLVSLIEALNSKIDKHDWLFKRVSDPMQLVLSGKVEDICKEHGFRVHRVKIGDGVHVCGNRPFDAWWVRARGLSDSLIIRAQVHGPTGVSGFGDFELWKKALLK